MTPNPKQNAIAPAAAPPEQATAATVTQEVRDALKMSCRIWEPVLEDM